MNKQYTNKTDLTTTCKWYNIINLKRIISSASRVMKKESDFVIENIIIYYSQSDKQINY